MDSWMIINYHLSLIGCVFQSVVDVLICLIMAVEIMINLWQNIQLWSDITVALYFNLLCVLFQHISALKLNSSRGKMYKIRCSSLCYTTCAPACVRATHWAPDPDECHLLFAKSDGQTFPRRYTAWTWDEQTSAETCRASQPNKASYSSRGAFWRVSAEEINI